MYHLTILWLLLVAIAHVAGHAHGYRRGRRRERHLWAREFDIVRKRGGAR